MPKLLLSCWFLVLLFCNTANAKSYTDDEAKSEWANLQKKTITDETFRQACDLIQDVGQTNLNLAYQFLAEYYSIVKTTGNKQWAHVLLMNWAKAKESLTAFEEADSLYRLAREDASDNAKNYDETLVGTVLMYLEWGRGDSLEKYLSLGEKECRGNNDKENLSFIYTFKGLSNMEDTASLRKYLDSAILLAENLPDKNALFTAKYNRAVFYSQFNLQQQVTELGELQELTKDSTLSHKPRFYERTAFSFRKPIPSIYYQLMLMNLLLTDYDNAWKFAELFYDATVKPNPIGAQAAPFNSVVAMVKAYQGDFSSAKNYLSKSLSLYNIPENKISYPTYHLAAGMIAEHENKLTDALHDYEAAYKNGNMAYGLHLMPPEIYYAHELIANNQTDSAQKLFMHLAPILKTRLYSAIGFYYYKYYAELMKAKGNNPEYNKALETFYSIKDSLANINHYRAIQEVETRMRVHDKEQQIIRLNDENAAKQRELRQQWIGLIIFTSLAALIIALLVAYARNQNHRKLQAEQIAKQNEILQQNKIMEMQKQHRIEVMQGAIDAEENERYKIADQLHDEAGGMLALASLNISSVLEKGNQHEESTEKIEKAHEILNSVSTTIREISHRLTPLVIEKYGFKKAIEDMAHSINLSGKVKVETVIIGFENDDKHPITLLNNLYRIIQELVHNILKHAEATNARIEVVEHENEISMMVEDDGIGIDNYELSKGKGLESIQSRIAYLNGKMEVEKKNDKGTLVVIEINV
ncbi:MAG TPA: ATP-binding protein [Puia sp.]|nr:ATP-binding protein [Puia sp.]